MDNPLAANVFGTLGAVLWSLQVINKCTTVWSGTRNTNSRQAYTTDLDELATT